MPPIPLLLSAGEASGDMYAARLTTVLKQRLDVSIFGMGGPQMRAAGVEIITDYSEVSVVGITEVLKRLPSLFRAMRHLVDEAARRRPPLAILTDFPGFHLRLARKLRPKGIRNVYYICPQFWAWRPWRVNLVRRRFAQALCIFPFEEKFYADAGVPVKFIGHPLVGNVKATLTRELFCNKYGLAQGNSIITLLPGSRRGEIAHHVPVLVEALAEIRQSQPGPPHMVVAVARGLDVAQLKKRFPSEWRVALQRHGHRGNRAARQTNDCRLPAFSADSSPRKTAGENQVFQHGKPDRRACRRPRIDPGRLHTAARRCGSPNAPLYFGRK